MPCWPCSPPALIGLDALGARSILQIRVWDLLWGACSAETGQCQGRVLISFFMRRMLALTPKTFQNVGLWKVPSAVSAAASTTLLAGSKENKASLCSALKAVRAGQRGKKPSLLASRQLLVGRSRGLRALPKTSRGPWCLLSPLTPPLIALCL